MKINTVEELEKYKKNLVEQHDPNRVCISVCKSTGCAASGANPLIATFIEELSKQGLTGKVALRTTGCHGFCERGPLVVIHPKKIFYQRVSVTDVSEIVTETIVNKKVVDRLLYINPVTNEKNVHEDEVIFYKKQMRLLFGNNGNIDPTNIEDYIGIGGYSGLAKALSSMLPEQIIDEIKKSGLRGRGGAGFPTGWKWDSCRKVSRPRTLDIGHWTKYVICNADEGDPGAFMDRSLLEGNPHSILEGMIIGAFAVNSSQGYIYVRNEYPLAIKHITIALEQAREYGLLGENILGSGFSFDIKINRGAGAFVCGESSALRASIEGRVGEPSVKYVHATEKGLWDKPTVLNNVKTWANIPQIINQGADWFTTIGTEKSKGTAIFSLVGKVNNTGLVEVPMGITIRELIYDIGGGIIGGKKVKAIQTGGPSGGCIPEKLFNLPIDFDALTEVGSMMGSGGMIVMDEDTCMVNIAKYFINFNYEESCGKCTPCREGTKQMLEILSRITEGKGHESDIELLQQIGEMVGKTSLCALGGTAPNPVLTTIRYFRDEYESHIRDKKCPAKVCRALIKYRILEDKCNGCTACARVCPEKCITGERKKMHVIDQNKCIKCGACLEKCKFNAIRVD